MGRSLIRTGRLAIGLVPLALALSVSAGIAGNVGVDLNIHVGDQPRQVVVPAPVAPPPPQEFYIEEDMDFVYPPQLGFYVAVGAPYDIFFLNNRYYLCRDGRWFRATSSQGPWLAARYRELPPTLRRHKIERIRDYRNAEYDVYRHDRDNYRGRHFVSRKEAWKEQRRDEKEYRKELKREEKEARKFEKEERKQHRHRDRDDD